MSTRLLTLARHAKSSWRSGVADDRRRPLNPRGRRDCERVPAYLADRFSVPDRLVTSDATRAVQTATALASAFDLPASSVVVEPDLYLAEAAEILEVVARHGADHPHLLLVGHNPGFTDLFNLLSRAGLDNLPTLGVAHMRLNTTGWDKISDADCRVLELIFPRQIVSERSRP